MRAWLLFFLWPTAFGASDQAHAPPVPMIPDGAHGSVYWESGELVISTMDRESIYPSKRHR